METGNTGVANAIRVNVETANNTVVCSNGSNLTAMANQVLMGDWGNNPYRQESLTASGCDYLTIQTYVNQLVETGQASYGEGITVENPDVVITVDPESPTVIKPVEETKEVTVSIEEEEEYDVSASVDAETIEKGEWTVKDQDIAAYEDGIITGVAEGKTTVTVSYNNVTTNFNIEVAKAEEPVPAVVEPAPAPKPDETNYPLIIGGICAAVVAVAVVVYFLLRKKKKPVVPKGPELHAAKLIFHEDSNNFSTNPDDAYDIRPAASAQTGQAEAGSQAAAPTDRSAAKLAQPQQAAQAEASQASAPSASTESASEKEAGQPAADGPQESTDQK